MRTKHQRLGDRGEEVVVQTCLCPRCKRGSTLKQLPANFKCADVVCDFCGYLAQVKSTRTENLEQLPNRILGAAWKPQNERMQAGIYFPLFVVLLDEEQNKHALYYLPADLQIPSIFVPRKPLSGNAKRAGWQGFVYDITNIKDSFVRLA